MPNLDRAGIKSFHKVFVLLFIIMSLAIPQMAYSAGSAIGLYSDCYFGDDFGDKKKDRITVRPIGKICYERCEIECGGLMTAGVDPALNAEELHRCRRNCKLGMQYSAYNLKYKDSSGNIQTKTVQIKSSCSLGGKDSMTANTYESSFIVQEGEEMVVKIMPVPNQGYGKLSLCGTDAKVLTPVLDSSKASDWASNTNWQTKTTDPSTWSARNNNITNTGIDIIDGDEISITLEAENGYYTCQVPSICATRNLLIKKPFVGLSWNPVGNSNGSNFEILPGDSLHVIKQNSDGDYVDVNDKVIPPEDLGNLLKENNEKQWRGLYGKSDTVPVLDSDGKITGSKQVLKFSGTLEGFSKRYTRFGVVHMDSLAGGASAWNDNLGGFKVTIERQGCIYKEGERLKYAILGFVSGEGTDNPKFEEPWQATWKPLTSQNLKEYDPIIMDKKGKLVFSIDVPVYDDSAVGPQCNYLNPICKESVDRIPKMYGYENATGQYNIQVEKANVETIGSNGVSDIVRKVRVYFFGNGGNSEGLVQEVFNDFVTDSDLIRIIQVTIVLFMTWTGFSYVVGLSPLTQRDGIIRLLNLSVVIILINPGSWEFFNTYLFGFFINGGSTLISQVINYNDYDLSNSVIGQVEQDPSKIFTIFDKVFTIISSEPFWYKIGGLIFSGWLGIYVFLAIMFGVFIFTIAMIKAFIIYMVSMVMLCVLLLLAPIFLTFVLFKYTRKMFMSWISQLISVTLQPVVVIATIGIFTNLFLAGIYAALGFTVCRICYFGVAFPVVLPFTCILPGFTTINYMHAPDDAVLVSPVTNLGAAFYILIIAHAMYVFINLAVSLINSMISQNFFTGVDLTGYANVADYTTGLANKAIAPFSTVLGTSREIEAARQGIRSYVVNPAKFMAHKADVGYTVTKANSDHPALTGALRQAARQFGDDKISDQDMFNVLKRLGPDKDNPDKVDYLKEFKKANISQNEIANVLMSNVKDGAAPEKGKMIYNSLLKGETPPKLGALFDKAQSINLKTDHPKVSGAIDLAIKRLKGAGESVSNKRIINEFKIMGDRAKALEKSNNITQNDLVQLFENGIAHEARGNDAPKEYALNRLMERI